jgi:hypothetical protein
METQPPTSVLDAESPARRFYLDALAVLDRAHTPYLVGGGYAMASLTGIVRNTKDLDLFMREADAQPALDALAAAGYRTEWTWPHFLGKALCGDWFVDILYNSGNGLCPVDNEWFAHSIGGIVLGRRVPLCPPEEMLWSKAFVQERDRFDGADVAHLVLAQGQSFDWLRLLRHFHDHEQVLLAHLLLFTYIYPSERQHVPEWVLDELYERIRGQPPALQRLCNGPSLAHTQYVADTQKWGFIDARLKPSGPLSPENAAKLMPA